MDGRESKDIGARLPAEVKPLRVSVIIPAYNVADTLERAVLSALAQDDCVREILVVENNSSDATKTVAGELSTEYDIVRLLHQPVQGPSAARNLGTSRAACEWLQYLDGDDELLPGKIDRQLALVDGSTDWVMGTALLRHPETGDTRISPAPDPWITFVHGGGVGHVNANLFRKSALLAVGGWPDHLPNGEDMELYLYLLTSGAPWVADHTPGAIYHDHDGLRQSRQRQAELYVEETDRKARIAGFLAANRPDYYGANEAYFRTALLGGIRQIFTHDPGLGREAFRKYFPNGIHLDELDDRLLPGYASLYRVVPFVWLETCRHTARKLRPRALLR